MINFEIPAELTLGTIFEGRDDTIYLISPAMPPPVVVELLTAGIVLDYDFSDPSTWKGCTSYLIRCRLEGPYIGPDVVKTARIGFNVKDNGFRVQADCLDIWAPNLPHIPLGLLRIQLGGGVPYYFQCSNVERLDYEHYVLHGTVPA